MKKLLSVIIVPMLAFLISIPAAAASFVPSVEQKQAPAIVEDISGNAAIITDSDGNTTPVSVGAVVVTPLSQAVQAQDSYMAETIKKAYGLLEKAASLQSVCNNFIDILSKINTGFSEEDMAVRDVFDISLYGDAKKLLGDGSTIQITLATSLKQDIPRVVLHYTSDSWNALDPENVTANADGSTTITVDSLSPFAIVVPADAVNGEVTASPQTSGNGSKARFSVIAATAAVLTVCFFAIALRPEPISKNI